MADATGGDTDVLYLGPLSLGLIALIAGLVTHSFIIGVNVTDWWEGRSVNPADQILTSLGICRMCTQCANTIYLYMAILSLSSLDSIETTVLISVYVFFTNANYWLTTFLSLAFCLKISNFHSRLFLYLRRVIEHRTGYIIVASVLLSALNCLKLLMFPKTNNDGTDNTNMSNPSMNCTRDFNVLYTYAIGSFLPLFFSCISSVLLFSSLYHHTTKMKMCSNLSSNLDTYYSVMKFIFFTLIYKTLYFTVDCLSLLYFYLYCEILPWLFIFLDFLPVLHSSLLIYRTAKLRSRMSKVLHNVTDFLFQRKETDVWEDIDIVAL